MLGKLVFRTAVILGTAFAGYMVGKNCGRNEAYAGMRKDRKGKANGEDTPQEDGSSPEANTESTADA